MAYKKSDDKEKKKIFLNDESLRKRSLRKKNHSQGTHKHHQIDTVEYQAKIKQIAELLKQGIRSNEIFATMLIDEPDLGEGRFVKLLKLAYQYAENELHKDRDYVFELHMNRYESIYAKSRIMTDIWNKPLDPKKDWHIIVARHATALKALRSKEDLIGLHDKSVVLEINEQKAIVVEKENISGRIGEYDIDKLSLEEAKELLSLIKASRTVPIEGIHRVTIKTTKIEINSDTGERNVSEDVRNIDKTEIQDIEFEEMPEEVVDKFKDTTPSEPQPEPESGIVLIDADKDKKKDDKDPKEIVDKLQSNVLQQFKNKLKKKS